MQGSRDGQAETVALLREALVVLGEAEPALRIRLLAALARALFLLGRSHAAGEVRTEALELARRTGDRRATAAALIQGYFAPGDATPEEVLAMLTEAQELAEEFHDPITRTEASAARTATLARLGRFGQAREELAALRDLADVAGTPLAHHAAETFSSSLALCEGRLRDAEQFAELGAEWGGVIRGTDTSGIHGVQLFNLRREQGRLTELAPLAGLLADSAGLGVAWAPGLVVLLCELGREEEARHELTRICEAGHMEVGRHSLQMGGLAYLADAAAVLGDEGAAALLYRELAPLEGGPLVIGYLVACFGAADRYLGKLAATRRDWDAAERHFERALQLNREWGLALWLAHTRYEFALMLRLRSGPSDGQRADELLALAASAAGTLELSGLSAKIDAAEAHTSSVRPAPDELSPREVAVLQLVARGLSNRDIGATLVISEHTAANHVRSILRKTGCANRTEATAYAYHHDLAVG